MRLMTRVVMMTMMFGVVLPLHAQTVASSNVPASSDSNVAPRRATPDTLIALGVPVADTSGQIANEPGPRDLRVAAHYTASRQAIMPTLAAQRRAGLGQPMALMIVGGAALLAGAIIGDTPGTIIMIGGAVIGLIGLYEYLQ